jgi:hypothetical protein
LLELGPDGKPYEVWVAESLLVASRSRWKTFTFHLKRSCFGAGTKIQWTIAENMRMKPCKYCVPHWERLLPHDIAPSELRKLKAPSSSKRRKLDDDFQSDRRARPQVKKDSSSDWTSSDEDTEADDRIYSDSVAYFPPNHRSFSADSLPFVPHNLADTASLSHVDSYSPYSEDSATDDQTSSSAWSPFDEITSMPSTHVVLHRSVSASAPRLSMHHFSTAFPSSIDIFNANSSTATGSIYNPLALPDLGWMDV